MELWNSLHQYLEQIYQNDFDRTFLSSIHYKECQNDRLIILQTDNTYAKDWFEANCVDLLKEHMHADGMDKDFRVEIVQHNVKKGHFWYLVLFL